MNLQNKKKRIFFRLSESNRLSFPILLNAWEQKNIDLEFELILREQPLTAQEIRPGDVILFSFMTSTLPDIHREILEIKKSNAHDILIVGGGPHITGEQELALDVGFDVLFVGPAERNFQQFGQDLLDNRPLKQIYYYEENGSDSPDTTEFDAFIPVSRHMNLISPLEIMRGCFWHCRYCSTHLHHVRFRSLDSIRATLDEIRNRGFKRVNFVSPSSMEYGAERGRKINLNKLEQLMELVASYGFVFFEYGIFPSEVRPDTVTDEGMALLKKYVVNKAITIGAQSGLNNRLRQLRRGHSVEDICRSVEIANSNGFLVNLDFIVGYPDETREERESLVEFIKDMTQKFRIRTHIHYFIPLAGSPYAFRRPTVLSDQDRKQLTALKNAGFSSDGWRYNEQQASAYFDWLKTYFPHHWERYY